MEPEVYSQSIPLIVRAAYLYYIKDMSQNQIASLLRVSVPTVSRLISNAKKEKIVEFVINNPYLDNLELEQDLKQAFHLKDVVIISDVYKGNTAGIDKNDEEKRRVAIEGARYVQRIITDKDILGITYGKTMYYMIHYLNPCKKISAKFVTLHGSIANLDYNLNVMSLVHRMTMAFGGENKTITCEGIVSNKNLATALRREKNISSTIESFDEVTIAVAGLGSFTTEPKSILTEQFTDDELKMLEDQGVVADVALRFINSEGKECDTPIRDRTIGIAYEQFKNIPTKIALVSGIHKKEGLYACLKGGMFDVVITNYELGKALLDLKRQERNNSTDKE